MPIRIGLIGLSDYAQNAHIRNLLALRERARITALWNRGVGRRDKALALFASPEPGERSNELPAVPALCESWQEVLGQPDVDAVIVTLPPDLNREVVTAALEAGKHVLVEKPLAHTLEDAKAITVAAKNSPKQVLQVGLEVRHGWTHQTMRRAIGEGKIGKPALIWVTCVGGADWAYRPGWVTDPVRTGGVFNVWGVHVLDLICDLAGAAPKQVFAIGGSYRRTDTPYP
ncbi:MAG TPA: Gfo/Idh/MocA family oxidoreductase, partial [Planctomycetota bacterium]|nr:Gfo/Idh/MocA family oxidoreductase [Planctomycetota bacterium]